ncbi:uncharacterized protein TA11155 [Theileria annulata]|uniref:Uncharacterized protein n=1 Tax=Theileria annulata TaxID=5874 RepID=Q4U8I1_THEAN|nr:uncharacterized protein TA11155 [Theileria annulata]CAI76872.1 hypothetical protein, conserved [Theileria annulata]|eukprot:XP_953497.1 hypothetical protein, conserved [Theileria annulata]
MTTKVYTVNICNKTSFTLYRNGHKLRHGTWITWLPEKIVPSSSVSISFSNSRSGHSCRSYLQYGVVLESTLQVLDIKFVKSSENDDFSCTFKLLANQNEVLNDNFKKSSDSPLNLCKIQTQVIDPNKSSFIESSETIYIVNIEETTDGSTYIGFLRNKHNSLVSKIKQDYEDWNETFFTGPYLVNLYRRLSLDFCWDFSSSDWRTQLRKSNLSVYIRIVNLTSKEMKLGSNALEMFKNCVLDEGVWVEYPNEDIPSLSGTEFGCKSNGFLGGTSGRCVYSILGESGCFTFSWDRPSIGAFVANCKHSLNKYSVMVHTESSNHSSVIFHIIDMFTIPLKILTAKAVSPKFTTRYQDNKLSPKYIKSLSTDDDSNSSFDNTLDELVITPFLVKHQFSNYTNDSDDTDVKDKDFTELLIKSPKHFFSSVNSKNINSPINKVSSDSSIYIEWMIGNEIFCKLFKFDEKIHLNSSVISAIPDNKHLVFNSFLLRLDLSQIFPKQNHIDKSNNYVYDTTNVPNRPYLKTLKQNEFLDYVVMIFHCVCDAFQPYINKCMTKKFGPNWLKICKLPTCHVWKNHDVFRIDLEGIIYIVTAYWMDIFEQVLTETTHLNTIQVLI